MENKEETNGDRADFYPPRLNPLLVRLMQRVAPILARWLYWVELDVRDVDLQQLKERQSDRYLLLPNHPTFQDPILLFLLSAKLKQFFYYLAAYETFDDPTAMFLISARCALLRVLAGFEGIERGLRVALQQLGLYSIRRGQIDRDSLKQTWKLLARSDCHLVIFPEGGCSHQNDTVRPFRNGAIHMAFQEMDRLRKHSGTLPHLYIFPVSLKYRYLQDMTGTIRLTLKRLERRLGLTSGELIDEYERLRAIAQAVLANLEREYGLEGEGSDRDNWNERIEALRRYIIEECERQLGISSDSQERLRERVYRMQYLLRDKADELESDSTWKFDLLEKSMSRLLNFEAIYDGYVADNPTSERFLDTLVRLEREVFAIDQPPPKGYRRAYLRLGEPIDLKDYYDSYRQDRADTVEHLVSVVEQRVRANLDRLQKTLKD